MNIEPLELGWLAGWIEGEGYFMLSTKGSPSIRVGCTDLDTVQKAAKIAGGRIYGPYKKFSPTGKSLKDDFKWVLGGKPSIPMMKLIYPLMSARRQEQIDNLLSRYNPLTMEEIIAIRSANLEKCQNKEVYARRAATRAATMARRRADLDHP